MPDHRLKPNICLVPAPELFMSMCETSVLHRTTLRCCRELGAKGIKSMLTVPISFVSEHIETLEEIDMEYRELAVSVEEVWEKSRAVRGTWDAREGARIGQRVGKLYEAGLARPASELQHTKTCY